MLMSQKSFVSYLSAHLLENACHNSFDGGGPLLEMGLSEGMRFGGVHTPRMQLPQWGVGVAIVQEEARGTRGGTVHSGLVGAHANATPAL